MKSQTCNHELPYIGARCTRCIDDYYKRYGRYPQRDWGKILERVAAVEVPPWVESPMGAKP